MEKEKQRRLRAAGWSIGDAADFLELSDVERELVEMKVALSLKLRKARARQKLTQAALARRMGSSQSRIAKMEAGDPGVSIDLLIQGLLAAGATRSEIASALNPRKKSA